jgi:motility quorum-sensing regulator/GCU-specific mRNA interferase toxin
MEKRKPTHSLAMIKLAASAQVALVTTTAVKTAAAIGFSRRDVFHAISMIEGKHFYKSVTTFSDHKVWHDVYHVPVGKMVIYVKLLERDGDIWVMSFKEK